MKPAGYLINTKTGLQGEPGFIYDYIFAGNGLFLEARSPLLEACICIAPVVVRGLAPLEQKVILPKGKIPGHFYDQALSIIYTDIYWECYLAVTWDGQYHLQMPFQVRKTDMVIYQVLESTIMDILSHGVMPALSSQIDNVDEQGFRISLVFGKLDTMDSELVLRLVMYGYYAPLAIEEVFDVHPG